MLERLNENQRRMEERFNESERRTQEQFNENQRRTDARFAKVEADLLVLKWMTGFVLAGMASLIAKAFFT